jgi:hypothetical protein
MSDAYNRRDVGALLVSQVRRSAGSSRLRRHGTCTSRSLHNHLLRWSHRRAQLPKHSTLVCVCQTIFLISLFLRGFSTLSQPAYSRKPPPGSAPVLRSLAAACNRTTDRLLCFLPRPFSSLSGWTGVCWADADALPEPWLPR